MQYASENVIDEAREVDFEDWGKVIVSICQQPAFYAQMLGKAACVEGLRRLPVGVGELWGETVEELLLDARCVLEN